MKKQYMILTDTLWTGCNTNEEDTKATTVTVGGTTGTAPELIPLSYRSPVLLPYS